MKNRHPFPLFLLISLSGCSKGPAGTLKAYFGEKNWEGRLAYVRKPETVKPLMEKKYVNYRGPKSFLEINDSDCKGVKEGKFCNALVVFDRGKNAFGVTVEDASNYVLQRTSDGWKVDWEASVAYNPFSAKAYEAQRPQETVRWRAVAELGNYYNFEFAGAAKRFFSIQLRAMDDMLPHGYVLRDSRIGGELYEVLKDGNKHAIMVDLRYLKDGSPNGDVAIIENFLGEGWVYDEKAEAASRLVTGSTGGRRDPASARQDGAAFAMKDEQLFHRQLSVELRHLVGSSRPGDGFCPSTFRESKNELLEGGLKVRTCTGEKDPSEEIRITMRNGGEIVSTAYTFRPKSIDCGAKAVADHFDVSRASIKPNATGAMLSSTHDMIELGGSRGVTIQASCSNENNTVAFTSFAADSSFFGH